MTVSLPRLYARAFRDLIRGMQNDTIAGLQSIEHLGCDPVVVTEIDFA